MSWEIGLDTYTLLVIIKWRTNENLGLPWWLSGKEPSCNAGDMGSIPKSGRSPGEGRGNPLQYYCLGSPMNRGAWRATVHGVSKESNMLSL